MYQWNRLVDKLTCLRCQHEYAPNDYFKGCPRCLEQGYPASLQMMFDQKTPWKIDQSARGMLRFVDRLPYRTFPTLGEGGTPVIAINGLAESLGIPRIWIKNEGQNPTGSHKDRMSPFVVARAAALGRSPVVAASSGNAGASLAAYAAYAGVNCTIIATDQIHDAWKKAISITGADIITVANALERWKIVRKMVEEQGAYPATNYHLPAVGSNVYGVQGYVTVGLEIVEQMQHNLPTAIIVPCARGDLLWGIWAGLVEAKGMELIDTLPRLYAVEPFPRLSNVLAGQDYRDKFNGDAKFMPSIGGNTVTYQSVEAVRASRGKAVVVTNEDAVKAQTDLARRGLYVEGSSAATLAAASQLVQSGLINQNDRILLIMTSHGYKGV